MDIDAYFRSIDLLAKSCLDSVILPHHLIASPGTHADLVDECLAFKKALFNVRDEEVCRPYLEMGEFPGPSPQHRMVTFSLYFDVQHAFDLLEIKGQCVPYHKAQKLFVGAPELIAHIRRRESSGEPDLELIDLRAVNSVPNSEVYKIGQGYGKLMPLLQPGIVKWAKSTHPNRPIFIRLDPHQYFETEPTQYMREATLVPANPRWLEDFTLHRGEREFAAYELADRSPSEALGEFWDYHMRGIRRLEVLVTKRKDTYLSMMIEELSRPDAGNGFMVTRCIHLDTLDPTGTPISRVELKHLDLAINVYCGNDRQSRFSQTLQVGKVLDATFRTHLFRMERVPFLSLFGFCSMFLQSSVLLKEWFDELKG